MNPNKLLTLFDLYCDFPEPVLQFYRNVHTIFRNQGISPIDRTDAIIPPLNFAIPKEYQLQGKDFTSNLSYKDCCTNKVEQIVNLQDKLQKQILINWSGGLDSTAIICAFISALGLAESVRRLTISLSPHAVYEYPLFFKKFILPNFNIKNSLSLFQNDPTDYIVVDGEPNGAICGPELLLLWATALGDDFLKKQITLENIETALKCRVNQIPKKYVAVLNETVMQSSRSIGLDLTDMSEWMWWQNFNFRILWYRYKLPILYASERMTYKTANISWDDYYINFFFDDDFQAWSINNRDRYHEYVMPGKWKLPVKEVIFDVTKDNDYKLRKGKVTSIDYLTLKDSVFAIDSDYHTVTKEKLHVYLNDKNYYSDWM